MSLKRIEVIVDDIHLDNVLALLERCGVLGYTAIEVARSKGLKKGESLREGLLPTTRKTLLFSIVPEARAEKLRVCLEPFLEERAGVLICSTVEFATGLTQ